MVSCNLKVMRFVTVIFTLHILRITVCDGSRAGSIRLSIEEDLELNTQLNILNKPPIKSFKDTNGDISDCINFYKQPAFDHPLLKDHKLQRKPSYVPKEVRLRRQKSRVIKHAYQKEFVGCPYGTVPFRRIKKEDLIRAKSALNLNLLRPINPDGPRIAPNEHYAGVTTASIKVYGAATSISVYNLTLARPQISEALLWIGTDIKGSYSSIEYGWTVNPGLYGDSQSHTYSLWTGDGFQNTGCYNAQCPGYVQVSQKRIMGEVNHPVTVPGEDVYAMEFKIFKDPNTSNWWLFENLGDEADEPVGYWPKELFPTMTESAALVQLGGKVSNPLSTPTPMGSGFVLPDDFTRTCYASNIQFVDSTFKFYDPKDESMRAGY